MGIFLIEILFFMACAHMPAAAKFNALIVPLILSAGIVLYANQFLAIQNISSLIALTLSFGMMMGQIFLLADSAGVKMMRKKLAMHFAHFAFALLVISITILYEKSFDIEARVKVGEGSHYNDDFYLKLTQLDRSKNDDFMYLQAKFEVWHQNIHIGQLVPEIRFYQNQNIKTNEVSILRVKALNDLYATIERYDESEYLYLRLQYKPLMNLVWLSLIMLAVSVLIPRIGLQQGKKHEA